MTAAAAPPRGRSKAARSGGATPTPRLPEGKRPQYPPLSYVVKRAVLELVRTGLLCVLLTVAVHPAYAALMSLLTGRTDAGDAGLGLSERSAFVLLTSVAHTGTYIVVCGGLHLAGRTCWRKYRFKRLPHQEPSAGLVVQTLVLAAVGQLVATPLAIWYFGFDGFKAFGMPALDAPLPPLWTIARDFVIARIWNDWGTYWVHRAMHWGWLYRNVHRQHHAYIGTISIASEFAALPETILNNLIPTVGAVLLLGSHPLVVSLWIVIRLIQTYEVHSGVCFVGTWWHEKLGLTNASFTTEHDFHHTVNRGCFGPFYLDWACGTMDFFLDGGGEEGYSRRLWVLEDGSTAKAA